MKRIALRHIIPFLVALIAGSILYRSLLNTDFINRNVKFEIELDTYQGSEMQFFLEDEEQFKSDNMKSVKVGEAVKSLPVVFDMPFVFHPGRLRFDPGFTSGKWLIKKITLKGINANIKFDPKEIFEKFKPTNDIKTYRLDADGVYLESNGPDPILLSSFGLLDYANTLTEKPLIYKLPFVFCICIGIFIFYVISKKLRYFDDKPITTQHVFALVFIIFISLPLCWMTLFINSESSAENRRPHEKPVFYFDKILEYPQSFNAYFDDNFGFRKELATFNSYYKFKLLHASSKPDIVAVGQKSWLYSVDPEVVGDYQNKTFFTDDQLKLIKDHLEEAYDWHAAHGVQFYFMMMPLKSNIYPEYLPAFMKRKNEYTKMLQLRDYLEALHSRVKMIDVTNELLAAKDGQEVYYQHDLHTNFQGGFIAYTKLMNAIHQNNPEINPLSPLMYKKVFKQEHDADLSRILSLENILLNDEWHLVKYGKFKYKGADVPHYETVSTLQPTVRTQIKNSKLPKVIVYRDSFFGLMIPFFSEHFSDCIYLWTKELSVEAVNEEKPDMVVYEMLESSVDKLLEDNPTGIRK